MRDTVEADAPGRVNLIGEHTDYHQGFVLPTVIPQRTHVRVTRSTGDLVHVSSTAFADTESFQLGRERPGRGWLDYVQGVTAALRAAGVELGAFDAHIASDVPVGGGVSSSAALTVALLRALRLLFSLALDDVTIAKVAQKAETDFVGAPVGIMDQMVCSLGRPGEALFLDTRTLSTERVPIPPDIAVVVIDSAVSHQHAGGGYADRRRESFEAAAALGVEFLRDVGVDALARIAALPSPLDRRARHVVTENARVLAFVDALRAHDTAALGRLLAESQASLRDDYEVSHPDVDRLVEIASRHPACFGARMTGGGFGGAVVILARAGESAVAAEAICSEYARLSGRAARVLTS